MTQPQPSAFLRQRGHFGLDTLRGKLLAIPVMHDGPIHILSRVSTGHDEVLESRCGGCCACNGEHLLSLLSTGARLTMCEDVLPVLGEAEDYLCALNKDERC